MYLTMRVTADKVVLVIVENGKNIKFTLQADLLVLLAICIISLSCF